MPPPPRHRASTSGRPSASAPMSERQQMALLMQLTSSNDAELSPNSQNAKPKDRNERGETSLHICAKKGDVDGAKKLLDQGIDPNAADFAGWTPLHEASNHGHYNIAQLLIKHGANVNATGLDDVTPLHDAASFGNQKLVKLLIDKGADPLFKNKKGKTAQDLANPSLTNFFDTLINEMANKRDSQQQQQQQNQSQKKGSNESKKVNEVDDGPVGSTSTAPSDVYEFVSTPKHSSCSSGSGDENPGKASEKSSDDKSGTENTEIASTNSLQKRALGDQQESTDENISTAEEEAKRKKRKESELKDGNKVTASTGTNRVTSRVGQKPPGPASKTMGLMNKTATSNQTERPSEPSTKSPESNVEEEDGKEGPKVPPLKIVIPQQAPGTTEPQETQNVSQRATNKPAPPRNHPYVVASSNSNDGVSDGTATGGRGQSPSAESNKSDDTSNSKPTGKSKEPRILRSSRKDAKDDRGSNNSSPQLPASSTPSPAGQAGENSGGNESETNQQSNAPSTSSSSSSTTTSTPSTSQTAHQQQQNPVELHPRKRKIKASSREPSSVATTADVKDTNSKDGQDKSGESIHPHDQPFTNCYQMYIDLRKQIEQRHRNLHPVEPRPLKGLEDYLMNRRTYLLQGKNSMEPNIIIPPLLPTPMKETFTEQEKERHKLKLRHIVEKEKLVLSKEQEILRVHCKAAQMIANQSQPFSVCTILKDEEVYNIITPEQEEKYRNKNRERSHGRVFYQALKELDDKYDKIKEAMITRHTNEAESLMAVQKMDWGWKMKEFSLCEYKANPEIEELFVPMIDVSDEYTTPSIKD